MLWFQVLFIFFVFVSSAVAEEVPAEILRRAEDAYRGGDFAGAFSVLSEIPGLLGVVPLLDQPKARVRAEIFFDLARIQIARKDTFRAKSILTHVFALDKDAAHGILDLSSDKALSQTRDGLARLRQQKRQKDLGGTTALGAAGRSFVLPGWGHIYRGHRNRAYVFMGATSAAAVYWFVSDRSYRSAYKRYRSTQISELNLGQRTGSSADPFPYKERFQEVQSRSSRANMALGLLAGVWLAGISDHLVLGPAHVGVVLPVF